MHTKKFLSVFVPIKGNLRIKTVTKNRLNIYYNYWISLYNINITWYSM